LSDADRRQVRAGPATAAELALQPSKSRTDRENHAIPAVGAVRPLQRLAEY